MEKEGCRWLDFIIIFIVVCGCGWWGDGGGDGGGGCYCVDFSFIKSYEIILK